ncbi:cytochrome c oxidase subunit II [Lederbergia citrea]|uniref:Cytochrome c oxidase subunit 2 n=1 Tax=Lederbergia citrea TaxID=2833581 RepID=A0A942UR76_9BACI|nr:cytochrome c oxidase subunit II [Lederbergia citrea]MBS4177253.1 cytochrome c oxidase subunit II [Lederbergia citrea]MBS4203916.1 cytochrome c oxidase subunit II [Lederbergia citrea]MBS4221499.1 cytochrome c oxidase subunit II [Lederbergia citrea]
MKKWLQKWRLASVFAILALVLSGCGEPFLSALRPAGQVAQEQYDLILFSLGIMMLVIVVVFVIWIIALVKFRRKKGEENKIPKQVEGSHVLEIIWTVIPIVLLLILAVPTVAVTFSQGDVSAIGKKDEDGNPEALVVNVRAHLYWWEFEYPDLGIVTSQDLVIPTEEKVYFQLKSADIKHSFWIPPLGGKLDTNPDNINKFWLVVDQDKATEAGDVFYGKCAELCGPSHWLMDFKVKALPKADFDQWVAGMQNAEKVQPSTDLAVKGEEIFNNSCITCHAVGTDNATPPEGRIAPNLANFGEREKIAGVLDHNEEELKRWLKDPESIKPGNKMTNTYPKLEEDELDALAAYLMELKVHNK